MGEERTADLHELADLVHAVARRLPAPSNLEPGRCTPIEISVMRFVGRNPGVSARAAADASGLPSSNFARVLKGLVAKGLLERRSDPRDARKAHLYPTGLAKENSLRMRDAWGAALHGAGLDRDTIHAVTRALRRIEAHLSDAPVAGETGRVGPPFQGDRMNRRNSDAG